MNTLLQDIRYTLRQLRQSPGFAVTAVLTLALGIGANVAVFSVVNTLMLRPLPFFSSEQLVWIAPPPAKCGFSCATYSTDAYDEFRSQTHSFPDVTGYFAFSGADNLSLNVGDTPIPATNMDVIANFFQVLGVQPAMGRAFTADDARVGASPVILLTDAWWRRQFGADPAIVGKAFDMNGQQTTVIGVLPGSFDFGAVFSPGAKVDAFRPLNLYGPPRDWGNIITMIGRLKPNTTLAQAKGDAQAVSGNMCWNLKLPNSCGQYKNHVIPVPLKEYVSGNLRRSLVLLWCAVVAILLIACVNLSNLLLARAAVRNKEFAMRSALGASRGRIFKQLLTESVVLSCAGAVVGLGIAYVLVSWLAHQGAIALPLLNTLKIDGAALGWTVLIAAVAALIFGIVPGLRMAGGNLLEAFKESGAGSGQGRKHERIRSTLVVTEVALACMLLVGAGLLLRSFLKILDVDLGFQPERAAALKVDVDDSVAAADPNGILRAQKRKVILQQILSRVESLPGLDAAGIADYLPLGQNRSWGLPIPQGSDRGNFRNIPSPLVYVISPGYLRAMGTRLRGRDFTWDDDRNSESVVLVNQSMARFFWPNEDAVGKILVNAGPFPQARVAGVVDDVHEENVDGVAGWQVYYSIAQAQPSGAQLVVRSTLPPETLATGVMGVLRQLNPKQSYAEFRPITRLVSHSISPRRFFVVLVGAFAALGLLLAALGIYGVISYSVSGRTQEIGVRMALGATRASVVGLVLQGALRRTLIGILLGIPAALLAGRLMTNQLYGVGSYDPLAIAGATFVLLVCATAAGFIPARRAASIDPMQALRNE